MAEHSLDVDSMCVGFDSHPLLVFLTENEQIFGMVQESIQNFCPEKAQTELQISPIERGGDGGVTFEKQFW